MAQSCPFIIGFSGISGAGKSTLVRELGKRLQTTALYWDDFDPISQAPLDYVKWFETSRNYEEWVYDELAHTLKQLKAGQTITCPATKQLLLPTKYILFDAPLGYCHKATGTLIDFLVCIDTPLDIALARRLLRDYQKNPHHENMMQELQLYLTLSRPLFILTPKEKQCDLLLDGSLSLDALCQNVLHSLPQ